MEEIKEAEVAEKMEEDVVEGIQFIITQKIYTFITIKTFDWHFTSF